MKKLNLRILRADISRDPNFILKMDPYCVIRTNNAETRTSVVPSGGKHPIWNEAFSLDVSNDRFIDIFIFDQETVGKDNAIAQTVIDLSQFENQTGIVSNAFSLSYRGRACGQLFVEFNFGRQSTNLNNSGLGTNVGHSQVPVTTAAYSQPQNGYYSQANVTASYANQGYAYSNPNASTTEHLKEGTQNLGVKIQNAYEQTKAKIADKLDQNPGANINTAIAYPDRLPPAREDVAYQRNVGVGGSVLQASQVAYHEPTVTEKLKQSLTNIGEAVQHKYQEVKERLNRSRGNSPTPNQHDFNQNVNYGVTSSAFVTNPLPITHPDFIRTYDNIGGYNASQQSVLPPPTVHQNNLQYRSVDQVQFHRSLSGNYSNYPSAQVPTTVLDNRVANNANYAASNLAADTRYGVNKAENALSYGANTVATEIKHNAQHLKNAVTGQSNVPADVKYGTEKIKNEVNYQSGKASNEVNLGTDKIKNELNYQGKKVADETNLAANRLRNEINYQNAPIAPSFNNTVQQQTNDVANSARQFQSNVTNRVEQTVNDAKNGAKDFVNKFTDKSGPSTAIHVSGPYYGNTAYQQSVNQSDIKQAVYVDQLSAEFRSSPAYRELRGKLIVKVVRAELTRDSNFISTMDPYCMLRTKGVELRTQVAEKGGKTPVWNAMFDVELYNDTSVYFGIWDRQTFSVDDIVADVTVDLRGNMKDLNRFSGWQPLYYRGDTAGRLFIELEYFPQGSGSNRPVQQLGDSYVNANRDQFSRTTQAVNYR